MKTTKRQTFTKVLSLALVVAVLVLQIIPIGSVSATQIGARRLQLESEPTHNEGAAPGGIVKHHFYFTLPSVGNADVGSIKFEYCELAAGACVMPTGLLTNMADTNVTEQIGAAGFTLDKSTNGVLYLTRTPAPVNANMAVSYQFSHVTNPSAVNTTFFVRITTYTEADLGGTIVDTGTVAASTSDGVVLSGIMPESLVFCTGRYVGLNAFLLPDCATAETGTISFDKLFSPTDTATTTSMMAASTNAGTGYAITVNGLTLYSGSNFITAMGSTTTSTKGVGQFGLNLKANVGDPIVGAEIAPITDGVDYFGEAATNYDTLENYKFTTGDVVADSGTPTSSATNIQIYSVSYLVNVPGRQPAGTYTTTLTYICTAQF